DRLEVRVSITKLLLSLMIVIVPLSVVGLILTERGDKSLDNAIGNDLKTMAQMYSDEVSQFMLDRVTEVTAMAADPTVVNAVPGAHAAQSASTMLGNSASQLLRLRRDLDARLLRIVATDANGTVIAATHKPAMLSY